MYRYVLVCIAYACFVVIFNKKLNKFFSRNLSRNFDKIVFVKVLLLKFSLEIQICESPFICFLFLLLFSMTTQNN